MAALAMVRPELSCIVPFSWAKLTVAWEKANGAAKATIRKLAIAVQTQRGVIDSLSRANVRSNHRKQNCGLPGTTSARNLKKKQLTDKNSTLLGTKTELRIESDTNSYRTSVHLGAVFFTRSAPCQGKYRLRPRGWVYARKRVVPVCVPQTSCAVSATRRSFAS